MMSDKSHVEAWKGVIDFTKVIISLAMSILTIIVGYLTLHAIDLSLSTFFPLFFLISAIIFSILGFGRAIPAVKTGEQKKTAIFFSNTASILLTLGIITILFIPVTGKQSIDEVLKKVEQTTKSMNYKLSPEACRKIDFTNEEYTLKYSIKGKTVKVMYSTKSQNIVQIGSIK